MNKTSTYLTQTAIETDILILGAGPGGCATALTLGQTDLRVVLLDKASFPRDKICGDAVSGKVLGVMKYIDPDLKLATQEYSEKLGTWGIRFFAPNGKELDIPFKLEQKPTGAAAPGFISKRVDFDQFLLDQVRERTSAQVIENIQITDIQSNSDGISLSDGTRSWRTQILIGADGAHSVVAKQLGGFKVEKMHYSAGIRAYYQGVTDFHSDNFIELHYIKSLLPGYFWIFPLPNGWANVGLGMLSADVSKRKVNLKKHLNDIIAHHPTIAPRFKKASMQGSIQGFGLPLGSKRRSISGDRFMLIGDAASLIDPFSGEGIGNAMISGRIAAQTAQKCFAEADFSKSFLKAYDQAVYKKIGAELRLSHHMQKMVNYPRMFNFVVNRTRKNEALRKMMTMMFDNLDIRKELRNPSFYWKVLWG